MLKVLRAVGDEFEIEDLDEGGVGVVSAETLVLLLAKNEFEGCKHSRNGIEVWYDGVEPYEIPIEVWKPVSIRNKLLPDGNWWYWVSNLGAVRKAGYTDSRGVYHAPRIMKENIVRINYRQVGLYDGTGAVLMQKVHRLVAMEFVYNKDNLPVVNHKDEIGWHNWAGNLEWMTVRDNTLYGTAKRRAEEASRVRVRQYSPFGEFIAEYESITQAEAVTGISHGTISDCCLRLLPTRVQSGFVWRYALTDDFYGLSLVEIGNLLGYVRQYTLNGDFVAEYATTKDVINKVGITRMSLMGCLQRKSKTGRGYVWRWSNDDEFIYSEKVQQAIKEYRQSDKIVQIKLKAPVEKRVVRQYTLDGDFVAEFESAATAQRLLGYPERTGIYNCCYRLRHKSRGFTWRCPDDDEFADRPENAKAIAEWRARQNAKS